jgi:hypothetical protein
MVAQLQRELTSLEFGGEETCRLIESYVGHYRHRFMTNIVKYIILGLASFLLFKEIFQLMQAIQSV